MSKLLTYSICLFFFSTYSYAKPGNTVIWLNGTTGSGDVKLDNTNYSVDLGGTSIQATFYSDNIYFKAGAGAADLTLAGVTITSDSTMVGFGVNDGRVDYITGTGESNSIGLTITDLEVTLGAYTSSETVTSIGYGGKFGLGDGVTFSFGVSTDFEDFLTDNSYGASFIKSFGSALVSVGIDYNTYITDARNSGNSTVLILSIGTQF